ncbi:MAG: hypothetical protein HUJ70_02610 [Pseudobutyrivibrio sp.]|nr:hypothetical protein [Pseudobutyrivibrio sp.]
MNEKKKPKKLRRWLRDQLNNKWRAGFGKKKEKGVHNETPYIHSENTYKTYCSQCNHFADWCMEQGIKDKDEAFKVVPDYINHLKSLKRSACSIYTAICAIAKAYGVSTTTWEVEIPKRERADIKRSRYAAKRDKHFSEENNKELITFGLCIGLRRMELEALRGNQLVQKSDGNYYITGIKGKGGKVRDAIVICSDDELKIIIKRMKAAGEGLVFNHVHSAFDEHYYRGLYVCRAYKSKARDIETLERSEKYICRKDKAGIVYDKQAMLFASRQLGHGRISVVAENYLYNL